MIDRVFPEHRRYGHGSEYLHEVLERSRAREAEQINTVVLAASVDGLAFAHRHGFVETERYEVDGVAFIDFTLHRRLDLCHPVAITASPARATPEPTESAAETQSAPQPLS